MAHLWLEESRDGWRPVALAAETHEAITGRAVDHSEGEPALLHAVGSLWVLTVDETVRVNAVPVFGGVRVLRDGDEIRVAGRRAFFAADEPARVEPFPGAAHTVRCPRCAQPIAAGAPAVRSRCGVWLHCSAEWPCWQRTPRCPECEESTALDGGYAWTPESL